MILLERTTERVGQFLAVIAALCLITMMFHIFMDVVGRFAFSYPLPSTIEIVAEWWMPALIFLPMVLVQQRQENIAVDLFYDWAGPRMQAFMNFLSNVCFSVFLIFLAWGAGEQALRAWHEGEFIVGMIPVLTWPARFFLPIAATLTGVLTVLCSMRALVGLRHALLNHAGGR